ncbi:MAG: hypothetical protein IPM39_16270 [Chloroflexi bacterium]|nr:hypothetical protein [Chloroflexota bacterium]
MSSYQTQFASAAREEPVQVMWSHQQFSQLGVLCQVLDAIENGVVILNPQRQVIYINQPLAEFANLSDKDEAIGLRVGEVIGCDHAFTTFGGCGTTEFCRSCGAITAILIAQDGQANVQECRIARHVDNQFDVLDLRVKATPLTVDGEKITVFSVTNIADEKRRQVLEHIFFMICAIRRR